MTKDVANPEPLKCRPSSSFAVLEKMQPCSLILGIGDRGRRELGALLAEMSHLRRHHLQNTQTFIRTSEGTCTVDGAGAGKQDVGSVV